VKNVFIFDYYSDIDINGLNSYVANLSKQLEAHPDISLHYVWLRSHKYSVITTSVIKKSTHIYVPGDLFGSMKYTLILVEYLQKICSEKKQIIFHFNWINHCGFAQVLKKYISCKALLTRHCIPWRDLITNDYRLFKNLNSRLIAAKSTVNAYILPALFNEIVAYNSVDHIICVTRFAKQEMMRMLNIPNSSISVISNGLSFKEKNVLKGDKRKHYGFDSKERIVLFAGTVTERKGVLDLINAINLCVERFNNVRLIISRKLNNLRFLGIIKKHYSKITITGPLDKKTLYDFYQMADIGVVPSYVEQCSYTSIEMMHFGLPIIVSDVDGLAEIVPNGCGLKVPLVLGKSKAYIHRKKLTDGILYFLNNPETAKEYAERARQHALKNFTAKKMVAETIKVYEKLIGEANVTKQELKFTSNVPLVSVLLPVYNGEKHLKECIDSILKQTYSNFELIIINDGSVDSTAKITERYRDSRIILFNNDHRHHQGESDCLSQGIKMAKGKFIVQIDADSIMHPERLQKQVAFLEDEKNKSIILVGCQHYIIDDGGKPVNLKQYPVTDAEIKATMLFRNPFSKSDILARSETLKKYKYAKKYEHAEDYQLWLKLLENNKGANINEFLNYKYLLATSEQQTKKLSESTASLLSEQLEKWGIDCTVEQLKIHIAINCGYGRRFFNSQEKIAALKNWIIEILTSQKTKFGYSNTFIKKMQQHIVEYYCDVY